MNKLYRIELTRWSLGVDQFDDPLPGCTYSLDVEEYRVIKETPKGAWIHYGFDKKFVKLDARKRFACPTIEEAAESFKARKRRQIKILKANLNEAEVALKLIDKFEASDYDENKTSFRYRHF